VTDIHLELPTTQPVAALRQAVERRLTERLGSANVTTRWEQDVLHLSGRGAQGTIELLPGVIRVKATLAPPLSFFKMKVERDIKAALEEVAG
jgi:hypothetical protein